MTNEEAKNLIKRVRTKGSYTGDYYMGFTDSSVPFNADIDILAEALEKQIPKKLIKNGNDLACPNCGSDEQFIIYKKNIIPEYCPICGQAIEVGDN